MTVFRAYDVRGVYGTELTEELARRVGESFGSYAEGGRVSLGRDTRISGPSLEKAFLEGVLDHRLPGGKLRHYSHCHSELHHLG